MFAGILSSVYYPNVYNSLDDLAIVDKRLSNEQIAKFGGIILKHGYEHSVMAIKRHRHHELGPEEAMLERVEANNGHSVAKPASLEAIAKCGAKPNVIALGRAGEEDGAFRWYPVNYALPAKNDDDNAIILRDPLQDETFLVDCALWLVENGMDDKIMLGICHQAFEPTSGLCFLEENFEDTRTSELRPLVDGQFPPDSIGTTFYFQQQGDHEGNAKPVVLQRCWVSCVQLDSGHRSAHTRVTDG